MFWRLASCFILIVGVSGRNFSQEIDEGPIVCYDGTLDWKFDPTEGTTIKVCYGLAMTTVKMDWDHAQKYCNEMGGQLPTLEMEEIPLINAVVAGSNITFPLGFVSENNKWTYTRFGQKHDSAIAVTVANDVLRLTMSGGTPNFAGVPKSDVYTSVVCEHRNSASHVYKQAECKSGFTLFAINNIAKCYLFYEFADPSIDAHSYEKVSSFCQSKNAELFHPIDRGDLNIMKSIGEASSGFLPIHDRIGELYGYIGLKVGSVSDEPKTVAGYTYAEVGITVSTSSEATALCLMLRLPTGDIIRETCNKASDFALCIQNATILEPEEYKDILGTKEIIIPGLKPEISEPEINDLSYLGVAPEAKQATSVFVTSSFSIISLIAITVALFIIQ